MKHFFSNLHCLFNIIEEKKGGMRYILYIYIFCKKKNHVPMLCEASMYRCPRNDNKEFNRRKNPYEPRDHMVVLYKPDFYNTLLKTAD